MILRCPQIQCFPDLLNQVLLNLIVNAAHAIEERYSEGGAIEGIIRVQTQSKDDSVELRVSDNGSGIPEAIAEKIFNPFFTTKTVGKGTGQGLAIVHDMIVNKHNGSIRFESKVDVGTTFIVEIPVSSSHTPIETETIG